MPYGIQHPFNNKEQNYLSTQLQISTKEPNYPHLRTTGPSIFRLALTSNYSEMQGRNRHRPKTHCFRVDEMAQQVKELAAKLDDSSLIPRTRMVEGKY